MKRKLKKIKSHGGKARSGVLRSQYMRPKKDHMKQQQQQRVKNDKIMLV